MPKIIINGKEIEFEKGMTVLQACELAEVEIPRFCYHEKLSIAGNCRMCLVEMEKSAKPIASCAMPAAEGMKIKTNTSMVEKARKGVMEFLLANHPLDCPVCDQGGECDLQDQSLYYGFDKSRFLENKRAVRDKYMGPLIKTQMTRCIHCTRCVRFAEEVAGVEELGAIGRGENMEITTYLEKSMESELSANVIDLCPVGALTSKPYAFEARPWELKKTESIDVMDAVGSNIRVDTYGWEVKRILPRMNEEINEEWISDKTRYSCDGLLKQRLDTPYIKKSGKLVKTSWDEALQLISKKLSSLDPSEIAGHVGDMISIENIYAFKNFLKAFNVSNIEFREKKFFINPKEKMNYIFNSTIQGIEKSDLILLIGSNPRHEATMINARIRKTFLQNNTPIFSVGNPGDLTYDYKIIGENVSIINEIVEGNHELSKKIQSSKKPLIIIGESALETSNAEYILSNLKNYLIKNNKINEEWNSFNILSQNASTVGAIDLGFYNISKNNNFDFFKNLDEKKFKLIYLLGSDNLEVSKNDEFIIYQGSHGDRGAEIADVILPSPAFTEQDGIFSNLEGRLQECRKASYPIEGVKQDWKIFDILIQLNKKERQFNNFIDLRKKTLENFKDKLPIGETPKFIKPEEGKKDLTFKDEVIKIKEIDYYFSNSISRSSKTMSECRALRSKKLKDGTNN
tara:strand:- start:1485 stop:3539 length:2055 start_codon:yes stop_codon:yes gene_type:complete